MSVRLGAGIGTERPTDSFVGRSASDTYKIRWLSQRRFYSVLSLPVCRELNAVRVAQKRGADRRLTAHPPADATDGHRSFVSQTEHQPPACRASGLSTSATQAEHRSSQSLLGDRHYPHPDLPGLRVSGRHCRLAQLAYRLSNTLTTDSVSRLCRKRSRATVYAGNLQHRPRQPVHQQRIHRATQGEWHSDRHGP